MIKIKLFPTKIELQRKKLMTILMKKIDDNTISEEEMPILRGLIELDKESLSSRINHILPKIGPIVLQKATVKHKRMLIKADIIESIHHRYSEQEIKKALNFITIIECVFYEELKFESEFDMEDLELKSISSDLKSLIDDVDLSLVDEFIGLKKI